MAKKAPNKTAGRGRDQETGPVANAAASEGPDAFAKAFDVSRETSERLQIYADLLVTWQKTINLVAPSTLDKIWSRHFADSAQLLGRAPAGARVWADLGSGAGFPGLVVAILLTERAAMEKAMASAAALSSAGSIASSELQRPNPPPQWRGDRGGEAPRAETSNSRPVPHPTPDPSPEGRGGHNVPASMGDGDPTDGRVNDVASVRVAAVDGESGQHVAPFRVILIESDARKCAFLAEVVRKTGIGSGITVETLNRRIENPVTQSSVGLVDVISARALAPLERLLAWSAPLMAPHTVALFLKGRDAEIEITAAHERWWFAHQSFPSTTDPAGNILLIQNVVPKSEG